MLYLVKFLGHSGYAVNSVYYTAHTVSRMKAPYESPILTSSSVNSNM